MSGFSQTETFGVVVAAAFVVGISTQIIFEQINRSRRANNDERQLNKSSLNDKNSPITSETVVIAGKVAGCGLGHVHPAALLPENNGAHLCRVRIYDQ